MSNPPAPAAPPVAPAFASPAARRGRRRKALWTILVLLLVVAQSLLVALTVSFEASRSQDEIDAIASEAAVQLRRDLLQATQQLQALTWSGAAAGGWDTQALALMRGRADLLRLERRGQDLRITGAADTPNGQPLFGQMPRRDLSVDTEVTCLAARRLAAPTFSRSYFVPLADGKGLEVLDLCFGAAVWAVTTVSSSAASACRCCWTAC